MSDESDKQPNFAFQKKLGIAECLYGDVPAICNIIQRLMVCMKETNKIHKTQCEFFRLDFRQPDFLEQFEFPFFSLIFDLKWGCKSELEKDD